VVCSCPFGGEGEAKGEDMRIKWRGTAALLLESGGTTIAFDPFLKRNKKLPQPNVDEVGSADGAFITHPHFDHFADIEKFTAAGLPVVYVSQQGIENGYKNGFSVPTMQKLQPIFAGDTIKIGAFEVTVYESKHCKFDLGLIFSKVLNPKSWCKLRALLSLALTHKKFPIKSSVFAFDVTDGKKRVFILGSAGKAEGVDYPKNADLLVFPFQGRSNMYAYAMPFVEEFQPKTIMLDHFDDSFPPLSKRVKTEKFIKRVAEKYPEISAFEPKENEWYEI
jgi:L-ascorbate metabolism protein UlaG (beta-lactamase superfamily)